MGGDLELLKRRILLEMQRQALQQSSAKARKEVSFLEVFLDSLTDDGRKMFERAVEQYGDAAKRVGEKLGRLISAGRVRGSFDAEAVYWIFRELGMPIKLETRIVYKRGGEVKSISELLREGEG